MFENVSKELLKKAMKAKTKDEALAILKEGGVELTEEDLQNISAGEEGDEGICRKFKICWTDEPEKCIEYCDPLECKYLCTWW